MGKLSEPNRKRGDTKKLTLPKYYIEIPENTIRVLGIPKKEVNSTIKKSLPSVFLKKVNSLLAKQES
ncbi:hypothetical protein [Hippea sp. KM1]|uniref:hypothetical protein n=1 Tax=Hippea sp. KM1 TaxID=944481 RepID=UPI00046D8F59|nr:hypothetical protein [Hippea sp. KM1]